MKPYMNRFVYGWPLKIDWHITTKHHAHKHHKWIHFQHSPLRWQHAYNHSDVYKRYHNVQYSLMYPLAVNVLHIYSNGWRKFCVQLNKIFNHLNWSYWQKNKNPQRVQRKKNVPDGKHFRRQRKLFGHISVAQFKLRLKFISSIHFNSTFRMGKTRRTD